MWAADGSIYFRRGVAGLFSVRVDANGRPGEVRSVLPAFRAYSDMWTRGYSVARDGRVLAIHELPAAPARQAQIRVVVNWFTELKRLVPVP